MLIEDCGGDNSWHVIQRLSAVDPRVHGIQFNRNFGQHCGITAGLDICQGDWVVDCDLQDRPEELPRLYAKAQEGYDVVVARRGAQCDPPLKCNISWLFYKIFSYLTDIEYDGESGNFRIMSSKVVANFRRIGEKLRFFGGLVQWMGFPLPALRWNLPNVSRVNLLMTSQSLKARKQVIAQLKEAGINTVFHCVPLHDAPYGKIHQQKIADELSASII